MFVCLYDRQKCSSFCTKLWQQKLNVTFTFSQEVFCGFFLLLKMGKEGKIVVFEFLSYLLVGFLY